MKRDLRAIVFDLDGVLADSEGLHVRSWQQLFEGRGLCFDPHWAVEWVGIPDVEIAARVCAEFSMEDGAAALVAEKRERFRSLVVDGLRSFEGVAAELSLCAAGSVPMAVGTASARVEAALMLQVMGFEGFFPVVVAGDQVPRVKPAPDIYLEAARLLGREPRECVALEDSPGGITAARAAGMRVHAVSTSFPQDRLREAEQVHGAPATAIRRLRSLVSKGG
ncbi:MAG: HAD family phosphatase [Spirochaetales bacterium]|nr:HAD family phosphatase [Spirochaetales bacterium]